MLQNQINEKKMVQKSEKDSQTKDALDREMYNQKKGDNLPPNQQVNPRQPYSEAPTRNYPPDIDSYPNDTNASPTYNYQMQEDRDIPRQQHQFEEKNEFPNYQDDEEFQRRLEEYKRDQYVNIGQNDQHQPSGKLGNPYTYDDVPSYQRQQEYEPTPIQSNPYKMQQDIPTYQPEPTQAGAKSAQRNYLVNNPIVTDIPNKRSVGGFRAHQEITHDHMKVNRVQKGGALNDASSKEAYNSIKKKYGNHSAEYNILTGT